MSSQFSTFRYFVKPHVSVQRAADYLEQLLEQKIIGTEGREIIVQAPPRYEGILRPSFNQELERFLVFV